VNFDKVPMALYESQVSARCAARLSR